MVDGPDYDVEFRRVALNMEQIRRYNPPPFEAKVSSSRCAGYVEEHGTTDAWELDALEPRVLRRLIQDEVGALFDVDEHRRNLRAVNRAREDLRRRGRREGHGLAHRGLRHEDLVTGAAACSTCGSAAVLVSATQIGCVACGTLWGRVNGAWVLVPDTRGQEDKMDPRTLHEMNTRAVLEDLDMDPDGYVVIREVGCAGSEVDALTPSERTRLLRAILTHRDPGVRLPALEIYREIREGRGPR